MLRSWRRHLWAQADDIVDLLQRENGKSHDEALLELGLTVEHLCARGLSL